MICRLRRYDIDKNISNNQGNVYTNRPGPKKVQIDSWDTRRRCWMLRRLSGVFCWLSTGKNSSSSSSFLWRTWDKIRDPQMAWQSGKWRSQSVRVDFYQSGNVHHYSDGNISPIYRSDVSSRKLIGTWRKHENYLDPPCSSSKTKGLGPRIGLPIPWKLPGLVSSVYMRITRWIEIYYHDTPRKRVGCFIRPQLSSSYEGAIWSVCGIHIPYIFLIK